MPQMPGVLKWMFSEALFCDEAIPKLHDRGLRRKLRLRVQKPARNDTKFLYSVVLANQHECLLRMPGSTTCTTTMIGHKKPSPV